MPINLSAPITIAPAAVTANQLWVEQLVIRWKPGQLGSAVAEMVPITDDGTPVARDAAGESLIQSVTCPSMVDYIASGNCPSIATAMTEILKAVQEIEAENTRLAELAAEEESAE